MLEEEHPRGAGPLVGCQLRCEVGAWLAGGCRVRGVGAQARMPRPSAGTTREGAPICTGWPACAVFWPGVECRTSHVLGCVVRRVGGDFEERYGYRPYLLETFVDRHGGASFRAAGWHLLGETAGRGRQGHAATETPKACLDADWRARTLRAPLAPLEVGADLDRENWAEQEFGGAPLGGLSARLVTWHQAEAPAFTGAARGDKAKAYYRLQTG